MRKIILHAVPEILSRITIGLVFIQSGWGKFHSLPKVTAYFESLHIPFANIQAPFVSTVELMAGLFIFFGLFTRRSSVPLIVIMLVAILTAKWDDIENFSSLLDISEFLYIVILLWLASVGSKHLSLDALLCKYSSSGTCKLKQDG